MAQTIRPEAVAAAFAGHLQPGEFLRHAVYGRDVAFGKLLAVIFVSLIPAVLIANLLVGPPSGLLSWLTYSLAWAGFMMEPIRRIAKDYLVGLADQRLILTGTDANGQH